MTDPEERVAAEERALTEARARGRGATLRTYARLSGPGWLQAAITLGGGTLASSLYLGVLTGVHLLWLQVSAMLLGVVMLAAIAHVTLSTGERPFVAIRDRVNPVLAWAWLVAVSLANLVWAMPQFSLGTAAVQQNLLPGLAGTGGKLAICATILTLASAVVLSYGSGARGARVLELVLKGMVALVVLCFLGVVATLAASGPGLPWGDMARGLVPDLSVFTRPTHGYRELLAQTGTHEAWWSARIVSLQQDVVVAAAATAVGINMTFLLPYSMLRRGWGRAHRGLATFDLFTGLAIPFALVSGCVVIAAATQFHGRFDGRLVEDPAFAATNASYLRTLEGRLARETGAPSIAPALRQELGDEAFEARVAGAFALLPVGDRRLAAMLVERDAFSLAEAIAPIAGSGVAPIVFGLGVFGMAISTAIVLMLINGMVCQELFGRPDSRAVFRLGALAAGLTGFLGPFVWTGRAKFWLAVPTSNFGMVLLPIAYWTFFALMQSRALLGDARPRGWKRWGANALMLVSASVATAASLTTVDRKVGWIGHGALAALLLAAFLCRRRR